ncbi:MAG: flagellar protein FlaG [Treponema sp.]|nr:flagellar protein FlaG [Treponema sp.]MBR3542795.1 flagellar protein FlaG [Treponema sp.]
MNTISSIGQSLAMDGQMRYNSVPTTAGTGSVEQTLNIADGASVVQSIEANMAQTKADVQQLQQLSDQVMGRRLQFSVNKELNSVIIRVVDPSTNKVLKEIPSEDMQRIKINMRKTMGLLFDQMI